MYTKKGTTGRTEKPVRRMRFGLWAVLFFMMLSLAGNAALAASKDTADKGSAGSAAKKTAGKIVTKNGKKYYKYANGKKAVKKFIQVKGKTYYFGKNGVMEKGWIKRGGEYYYLSRSTGARQSGCTVDGIRLTKDGKAKQSSYNKKKIETMIEAKNILNKITKTTDSKSQKLRKAFNWVLKHPYRRYRVLTKNRAKGWETVFANDVYKKGNGCCVSEACAFAFLAHECGYKAYVCDDTAHAWTEINGRVFDTLFAEAKSYANYYNSSYHTAKLWCINKLKI